MNLFFTGNLKPIGNSFFKNIIDNNKLVVCGKGMLNDYDVSGLNTYEYDNEKANIAQLFQSFDFHCTIFFSMALDGQIEIFDELELLESALYHCSNNGVKNFIYITSNEYQKGEHKNSQDNSRYIFMDTCEILCKNTVNVNNINVTIIRIPYIYSRNHYNHLLGRCIVSAAETDTVTFPGTPDNDVDFLSEEDLAKLLLRMFDEPYLGFLEINISGNNKINFQELGETFIISKDKLKIKYCDLNIAIPQYHKGEKVRELYGWYPLSELQDDLSNMIKDYSSVNIKKRKRKTSLLLQARKIEQINIAVEMVFLYAIVVLLNRLVRNNAQLSFLDFRLIFVVIMGTTRGLGAGVLAAAIAGLGYYFNTYAINQWQILFYNVANWLPFGIYFLVGSVVGYTNNKKHDMMVFLQEEQKILENKYVFLNELYIKTLENKNAIHSQVLNYKDSYGKIYTVVQKLESTLTDGIFYEAVNVLEDILANRFVSIYSVFENSDFARLVVCSKSLNVVLNKSIRVSDYSAMMATLQEGRTWINVECLPDYPTYATAIFKESKMIGMIFIMQASDQQMNLDFNNKFNIITGLIKGSIVRAIDRMVLLEKETMIPGTKILNKGAFIQVLAVKKKMKEKEFSEYVLLKIKSHMELSMLSDMLLRLIRSNDVIGQGEDNNIYLVLSQTNKNNISAISKRLESSGLHFELIDSE